MLGRPNRRDCRCWLLQVGIAEALELLHQDDVVFVDTRDPSEVVKTGVAMVPSPVLDVSFMGADMGTSSMLLSPKGSRLYWCY